MTTSHQDSGTRNSRTISWYEPALAMMPPMTGVDQLRAIMNQKLPNPPFAELMGIRSIDIDPGRVVFTCDMDGSMYNVAGIIHGGIVCTLLDTAAGCALLSTLPAGKSIASIEIKVNYLRPAPKAGGILTATGTVIKAGSRVGFTEAIATDEAGSVIATASSTLMISDL